MSADSLAITRILSTSVVAVVLSLTLGSEQPFCGVLRVGGRFVSTEGDLMAADATIEGIVAQVREEKLDSDKYDVYTVMVPVTGRKPFNHDCWVKAAGYPDDHPMKVVKSVLEKSVGKMVRIEANLEQQNGGSVYKLKPQYAEPATQAAPAGKAPAA